jgi:ATP-dependent Lon protease
MAAENEAPHIPDILPLIPLRDLILFPNLVVPLFVGRERSITALEEAMRQDHMVALVTQRQAVSRPPNGQSASIEAVVAFVAASPCTTLV